MSVILAASSLGLLYVGSLYVWKSAAGHDRDSPHTIRRRFLSAGLTVCIAPIVVLAVVRGDTHHPVFSKHSLWTGIGVRTSGLLNACVLPLALTVVLFAGPLVTSLAAGNAYLRLRSKIYFWQQSLTDWILWRNYVVAPFTEEFTFRACMLPILLGRYSTTNSVLFSPTLFGIAHFHHMIERIRTHNVPIKDAFAISFFQFTYTTVFGVYSAYLFVRTGHLASCVAVHAFCNYMGFPDFSEVLTHREPSKRLALSAAYVAGLAAFFFLLNPMTEPSLYSNQVFQWST